jgi:hypothetical protein
MKKKQEKTMPEEIVKVQQSPQPPIEVEKPQLLDFDTWHAIRQGAIPSQHKKEILKADFKARGLLSLATMEQFDEALEKYGVKL